jgi:hypothetical protein
VKESASETVLESGKASELAKESASGLALRRR